jgi:hypothetical protein
MRWGHALVTKRQAMESTSENRDEGILIIASLIATLFLEQTMAIEYLTV